MNEKSLSNNLESRWTVYENSVFQLANNAFDSIIKPYLKQKSLNFAAGNGTYVVWMPDYETGKGLFIDPDKLPKRISKILDMEIPGMNVNCLGSLMPDYDYATDIQNNGE